MMRAATIACLGYLLLCTSSALADEASVYESIDDIDIGPVFLSPAERERLDVERLRPPAETSTTADTVAVSAKNTPARKQAAGYIVSSSGSRREWSGNDFVATPTGEKSSSSFPGDVPVLRHAPAGDAGDGGHGEDDK